MLIAFKDDDFLTSQPSLCTPASILPSTLEVFFTRGFGRKVDTLGMGRPVGLGGVGLTERLDNKLSATD